MYLFFFCRKDGENENFRNTIGLNLKQDLNALTCC